ncbi:17803_t:CDS:2 [Acaulospora morrowiae]|uniref:17803_t:CDS:1 n=1 Tax=Acaulospora morrowiae TaxID=94023 RepID=A0A9N9HHW1_9GLOM|nr:17803_t:CDS:2 [Acaulospora morrowiae]
MLKTEIAQHIGGQPQTIFKLENQKIWEKNNKDFLTITLGDFNRLANPKLDSILHTLITYPKKNTHGKITMELQHELITFGCFQIQTGSHWRHTIPSEFISNSDHNIPTCTIHTPIGDDQIISHNTFLKTNIFNTKATKAKQWKLFQKNLDKEIEQQEELHNTIHMSVERLWNITWNSICITAKRHVRKANPKKISTRKQGKNYSHLHNLN